MYIFWTPLARVENDKSFDHSPAPQTSNEKDGKHRQARHHLRIAMRGPVPFMNRFWDIYGLHAQSGWTVKIRTYNLVPWNSPAFRCATEDDLQGLKGHGKTSPYDVSC